MRTVHFGIAVWGERYTDTLLSVALPSFLAPGNIPAAANLAHISLTIVTRPDDVAQIESHPAWVEAGLYGKTEILPVLTPDVFDDRNRYEVMAFGHREIIRRSLASKDILSVLSPDCIAANGSLEFGIRRVLGGDNAVLVAGPRAILDYVVPALSHYRQVDGTAALSIPPGDAVSLVKRWPHPITSILFWEADIFSQFPSAVYWATGKESFVARYFHLHPIFVDLANADAACAGSGTVDGTFISLAKIPPEKILAVQHSSDICTVELSRLNHDPLGSIPIEVPDKAEYILEWARKYADPDHRRQFVDRYFFFEGREKINWPAERERVAALTKDLDSRLLELGEDSRQPALSRLFEKLRSKFG